MHLSKTQVRVKELEGQVDAAKSAQAAGTDAEEEAQRLRSEREELAQKLKQVLLVNWSMFRFRRQL